MPKQIERLQVLEEELNKDGLSLDIIGFRPLIECNPYLLTPPDSIAFADTGGDGIHFAFLTDFSEVANLEEAPIVCVSPTNDPPLRYMARNIKEFLDLIAEVPHGEMLEQLWDCDSEAMMEQIVAEFWSDTPADYAVTRKTVQKRFQQAFHTEPVQVIAYLKEVREERAHTTCAITLDGIGVIGEKQGTVRRYLFNEQFTVDAQELVRMQQFLQTATRIEQLAFIRDVNYRYVVSPSEAAELFALIVAQLKQLQLDEEVKRMLARAE